ncbi:MAG: hypothetical protein EXS55_00460 [Candidatus Magasanikbacteria bacterium]|nr:hypothetical protein [Candidatus Magasanikbacteria bacterium]
MGTFRPRGAEHFTRGLYNDIDNQTNRHRATVEFNKLRFTINDEVSPAEDQAEHWQIIDFDFEENPEAPEGFEPVMIIKDKATDRNGSLSLSTVKNGFLLKNLPPELKK